MLKGIGDRSYQESLLSAHRLLNGGKTVKLFPSQQTHTIHVQYASNGKWKMVGYVVKESCDSIHQALDSNSVTSTKFD